MYNSIFVHKTSKFFNVILTLCSQGFDVLIHILLKQNFCHCRFGNTIKVYYTIREGSLYLFTEQTSIALPLSYSSHEGQSSYRLPFFYWLQKLGLNSFQKEKYIVNFLFYGYRKVRKTTRKFLSQYSENLRGRRISMLGFS